MPKIALSLTCSGTVSRTPKDVRVELLTIVMAALAVFQAGAFAARAEFAAIIFSILAFDRAVAQFTFAI